MTKIQFEEYLDNLFQANNINSKEDLTDSLVYEIGVKFKQIPNGFKSWNWLNKKLFEYKTSGEGLRSFVKDCQYKDGTIEENSMVLKQYKVPEEVTDEEKIARYEEKIRQLQIQQVKTRAANSEYRKNIRTDAYQQMFEEAVKEGIKKTISMSSPIFKKNKKIEKLSLNPTEGVLLISDWHYGEKFENYYSKYDTEIAKKRINKVLYDTINLCKRNNTTVLNVLNLGDMFAGMIHVTNRIEAEYDVITQVMQVSELLANFLYVLGQNIPTVTYRSCLDNHSRLSKDYKEHVEKENVGRLIDFWLEERLKNQNSNVKIVKDNIDENIGKFKLQNGKNFVFAHGHLDQINSVFQTMTGLTQEFIHYCALGHYHTGKFKEYNGFRVIVNGSMVGSDPYAFNKRLFSEPSQTLLIFDDQNLYDCRISCDIR